MISRCEKEGAQPSVPFVGIIGIDRSRYFNLDVAGGLVLWHQIEYERAFLNSVGSFEICMSNTNRHLCVCCPFLLPPCYLGESLCSKIKVIYLGQEAEQEKWGREAVACHFWRLRSEGQLAIPDLILLPRASEGKIGVFSRSSEILSAS